jgi:hypothetical protein
MSRKSQERVQVSIANRDGVFEDWGIFDTWAGGEADSNETRHRGGGMAPERALGGQLTIGQVTVTRLYDLERDHERVRSLLNRAGKARIVAQRQKLDLEGDPFGEPMTYTGITKSLKPGDADSESDDPQMLEIEFTPDGSIA